MFPRYITGEHVCVCVRARLTEWMQMVFGIQMWHGAPLMGSLLLDRGCLCLVVPALQFTGAGSGSAAVRCFLFFHFLFRHPRPLLITCIHFYSLCLPFYSTLPYYFGASSISILTSSICVSICANEPCAHAGYEESFRRNETVGWRFSLDLAMCCSLMKFHETPALEAESETCGDTVGVVSCGKRCVHGLFFCCTAEMVSSRH